MNTKSKQNVLNSVRQLDKMFKNGKIPRLAKHEVHPELDRSSRENYLYFTLAPSINFQRSSPALWQAAYDTFMDKETNYVFFPEKVIEKDIENLRASLTKHKLALQMNKQTQIWFTICHTLHSNFANDPRSILQQENNDVRAILQLVQVDLKKQFPYLSGPKLSNYWLFILSNFTDAKLKNAHEISIIPDTHIVKSSVRLGLVPEGADPLDVDQAWRELLEGTELTPVEMHSALWNWSRSGFEPEIA